MKLSFVSAGFLCLLGAGFAGCSSEPTGPEKFPVDGVVIVNGEPADRVAVTFHHGDASLPSNLQFATAVTDPDGRFELSTQSERDGAIRGTYRVTFAWMSSPDLDGYDMLGGAFADASQSQFTVDVPDDTGEPITLSLEVPENQIRWPSASAANGS